MDTFTRMRTFVEVVETGGFSAAARKLGRSKALISKYVKENYDFRTVQSKRHVRAINFSEDVCEHLNMPRASAGFRVETFSYDQFGRVIEISHTYVKSIGTSMQLNYF